MSLGSLGATHTLRVLTLDSSEFFITNVKYLSILLAKEDTSNI